MWFKNIFSVLLSQPTGYSTSYISSFCCYNFICKNNVNV